MNSDQLKTIRAKLGFTQTELGNELSVSLRTIQHWEGKRGVGPSAQKLIMLYIESVDAKEKNLIKRLKKEYPEYRWE